MRGASDKVHAASEVESVHSGGGDGQRAEFTVYQGSMLCGVRRVRGRK